MSQFCTMTTRERQMQAAAICREIQGSPEMDLGRKVSAPKDIMLEELSLTSNRGSRLFKMRQRRSEKYTFESVRNETNTHTNNRVTLPVESQESTQNQEGEDNLGADQTIIPEQRPIADPECIAPGYGGHLKDVPPERFNSTAVSYHSPWRQAISSDPALADTLLPRTADPQPRPEEPEYKSFNRVATPFGSSNRSSSVTSSFKAPEKDASPATALPDYPELQGYGPVKRPTFNRTALGWVTLGTPPLLSTGGGLDPTLIPESDDL